MMKKIWTFLFFIGLSFIAGAQDLSFPSEPADTCGFSLGAKGTIRLIPSDSGGYRCSYLAIEPYREILKDMDASLVFPEKPAPGTIDFFFGIASQKSYGGQEKNVVVLIMNNGYESTIRYKADIQIEENGDFTPTSVLDILPGVRMTEIWPHHIEMILLHGFEKSDLAPGKKKNNKKQRSK